MSNIKKIWGVRASVIGDSIMALPILTYLENKYPNSYKTWVIFKSCSQSAPLYLNHPLIDRIHISEEWGSLSSKDVIFKNSHDIIINESPPSAGFWYNDRSCLDNTVYMAGIDLKDFHETLTEEEKFPKLTKWFNTDDALVTSLGYGDKFQSDGRWHGKFVSIWPFAGYCYNNDRNCSLEWWSKLTDLLVSAKIPFVQFGTPDDPTLNYDPEYAGRFTDATFFDQIRGSLNSCLTLGTDSGNMWVHGAYNHPSIHLLTDHKGNIDNPYCFAPANQNTIYNFFASNGCDNIKVEDVFEKIKEQYELAA